MKRQFTSWAIFLSLIVAIGCLAEGFAPETASAKQHVDNPNNSNR